MDGRRAGITRREALRDIGIAGLGIGAMSGGVGDLIARAAAASPKAGKLKDIEHVVFLMQENRSFDHYFGTLSGVRGFDDRKGRKAFTQVDKARQRGQAVPPHRGLPARPHPRVGPAAPRLEQRPDGLVRGGRTRAWTPRASRPRRWATTSAPTSASTTRSPTRSRSATATTAR